MLSNDSPLRKKQKDMKQRVMEACLDSLFGTLQKNHLCFDNESALEFVFSILVMFNREVLTHTIISSGLLEKRKDIVREVLQTVKDEVNKEIKKRMN